LSCVLSTHFMAQQPPPPDPRRLQYAHGREIQLGESEVVFQAEDDELFEAEAEAEGTNGHASPPPDGGPALRSQYALTRQEIAQNIANRFVHSRTYIFLYLGMAALSITTVVLSLLTRSGECPMLAFYILEIIVNTTMIAEVGVRLVAFGRRFWSSPYNTLDLGLTVFCALTLLVLAFSGCGSETSREEELLDTLLLVARNVLQFGRLAAVMRKSGRSIFARPKPIDLGAAQQRGFSLDIDMLDDSEEQRPLV